MAITRVVGVDCHCRIAQHRFRSGCRHGKCCEGIVRKRVANMVELPFHVFMFDFDIRESRQAAWAPVDQPLPSVNQPVFIETHEDFQDSFR
ncbi:MAG: hypothetical protein JW395_0922 [Nitrospira sp.]|nr:hypothetical protein [Nitrospira sp.]